MTASDIYQWGLAQQLSGMFVANPAVTANLPTQDTWYTGQLIASAVGQIMIAASASAVYTNITSGGAWVGWTPIATATPPQVFDLPLAAGITANEPIKYCKTQDGFVYLQGSALKADGFTAETIVGTLPEGYRPSADMTFPVTVTNPIGPAAIWVKANGTVSIVDCPGGSGYLKIFALFQALS